MNNMASALVGLWNFPTAGFGPPESLKLPVHTVVPSVCCASGEARFRAASRRVSLGVSDAVRMAIMRSSNGKQP